MPPILSCHEAPSIWAAPGRCPRGSDPARACTPAACRAPASRASRRWGRVSGPAPRRHVRAALHAQDIGHLGAQYHDRGHEAAHRTRKWRRSMTHRLGGRGRGGTAGAPPEAGRRRGASAAGAPSAEAGGAAACGAWPPRRRPGRPARAAGANAQPQSSSTPTTQTASTTLAFAVAGLSCTSTSANSTRPGRRPAALPRAARADPRARATAAGRTADRPAPR